MNKAVQRKSIESIEGLQEVFQKMAEAGEIGGEKFGEIYNQLEDAMELLRNTKAEGGVIRFDRHAVLNMEDLERVRRSIEQVDDHEFHGPVTNMLYGIYDGYLYEDLENISDHGFPEHITVLVGLLYRAVYLKVNLYNASNPITN